MVQKQAQVAQSQPWVAPVRRLERVSKDGKGSASPAEMGRARLDMQFKTKKQGQIK